MYDKNEFSMEHYYLNYDSVAAAAKSLQSCPTPCDPTDGCPPGFPVPGILQARILEWVAISFSNAWKWKVKVKPLSCVQLLATPWTTAYQAPLPWDLPGKSTGVGCHCFLHSVASNQQLFIPVGSEILYQMVILHVTKSWSYSVILYEVMCCLI